MALLGALSLTMIGQNSFETRRIQGNEMANWDADSVRQVLKEKGWFDSEREIEHAVQFTLTDGTTKVNCYRTGRIQVQGKDTSVKEEASTVCHHRLLLTETRRGKDTSVKEEASTVCHHRLLLTETRRGKDTSVKEEASTLFAASSALSKAAVSRGTTPGAQEAAPRRVFIVYGHDIQAREQLELLLRRLRLDPIVLQNIPGGGDTIIEKLEVLTDADYACVLVTPDDEGRKRSEVSDKDADLRPRARQNVVLELGMVLSRLGRSRVAVLVKGSDDIERPSDIDGLLYIEFSDHVDGAKNQLAANLQKAGFDIQIEDLAS